MDVANTVQSWVDPTRNETQLTYSLKKKRMFCYYYIIMIVKDEYKIGKNAMSACADLLFKSSRGFRSYFQMYVRTITLLGAGMTVRFDIFKREKINLLIVFSPKKMNNT